MSILDGLKSTGAAMAENARQQAIAGFVDDLPFAGSLYGYEPLPTEETIQRQGFYLTTTGALVLAAIMGGLWLWGRE